MGRTVVITQGSLPVIVVVGSTSQESNCANNKIAERYEFEVPKIDSEFIIDTNGAGDSFTGGFLAGIILNKGIENAVKAGNWMASQII